MGIVAVDPEAKWEYVPEAFGNRDEPEDRRVVAVFRVMDARTEMEVFFDDVQLRVKQNDEDEDSSPSVVTDGYGRRNIKILRHSLHELRNFRLNGELVNADDHRREDGSLNDLYLTMIHRSVRVELGNAVINRESLSEKDLGKSEPSPSDSSETAEQDVPSAESPPTSP